MKDKHQAVKTVYCGRRARCGIFGEDPEAVAWADPGVRGQPLAISCNTLPVSLQTRDLNVKLTQNDGSVVAWTDGACVCNQDVRFRRAGCGVFFSIGDGRNRSFTLHEQTNKRAELLAAIAAIPVRDGNLEIRSNSKYVVLIATGLLHGERQRNIEGNADLWVEFASELRLKTMRRIRFVWVKRHATKSSHRQVDRHCSGQRGGNDAADALASAAAAHHAAPQVLTEAATKRQRVALSIYVFVAELLF